MRILYVSNAYPPAFHGGAELIAHFHAKTLKARGHDVFALAADLRRERIDQLRLSRSSFEGIPVDRIAITAPPYGSPRVNFFNAQVEALFAETLREIRPDVVHFHNVIGLSAGIIGQSRRFGAKTVLTVHDPWGFCLRNTLLRPDGRVCDDTTACSQCQAFMQDDRERTFPVRLRNDYLRQQFDELDAIVSPSRYLARGYLNAGFPLDKVQVIGNGVDLPRYGRVKKTPAGPGQMRFTFLGYVGHHKGVLVLLKALEDLPRNSGVVLNVVGHGVLDDAVRAAAQNLADRCTIVPWGKIPNHKIENVFAQTDVLISPSIWPENQPGTILEAMATGTAVIATRLGGNVELVDDGATGYLFEAGHAAALTRRMLTFVKTPRLVASMGDAARAKVADFSFERQVDTLMELYNEPPAAPAWENAPPLVLCAGRTISQEAYWAIDRFDDPLAPPIRFALADWFGGEFPENTRMLWFTGPDVDRTLAERARERNISILRTSEHRSVDELVAALEQSGRHAPRAVASQH